MTGARARKAEGRIGEARDRECDVSKFQRVLQRLSRQCRMSTTGNAPTTFSSVHMRERDKIIREKHDKELSALHSKVNRLRYSNDDLRKQIHDVEERARRLSNALGFEDFVDAQVFISTADQGVSYKECFEQVGSLRAELDAANFEVEDLKAQIALADQERQEFKAKLDASRKLEQEARSVLNYTS